MSDKKLAMFNEIEKIKKQEQFVNQNDRYQLQSELSQIDYQKITLSHQLKVIEEKEKSISDSISKIHQQRSTINEQLLSSNIDTFKKSYLSDELNTLSTQELNFYGYLKQLNIQKSSLLSLSYELDLKRLNILNLLNNRLVNKNSTDFNNQHYSSKITSNITSTDSLDFTEIDKENYLLEITNNLFSNKISIGSAIKKLRVNVLKINQEKFAKLVGVSRKTISEAENNRGNLSVETLNAIAKPFKLKLTLLPISPDILEKIIGKH